MRVERVLSGSFMGMVMIPLLVVLACLGVQGKQRDDKLESRASNRWCF